MDSTLTCPSKVTRRKQRKKDFISKPVDLTRNCGGWAPHKKLNNVCLGQETVLGNFSLNLFIAHADLCYTVWSECHLDADIISFQLKNSQKDCIKLLKI